MAWKYRQRNDFVRRKMDWRSLDRQSCCVMAILSGNKYNPIYNLQTMIKHAKKVKLGSRGNLMNKQNENKPDQFIPGTGNRTGCYEIRVKGQLDESWSDWLEGLEVKLLDNGEMILSGQIGDQAALMGALNKLYGLNLALLSVSEVGQIKLMSKKE
jgi:hypothetical protein